MALSYDGTNISGAGNIPVADTGYTANSGAGTKTQIVANYAGGGITGAMITALNTVSAGLGTYLGTMDTQVAALTAKLAAIETSLAGNKLPNA